MTVLGKVGTLPATFRFILGHPLNSRRPVHALWTWARWQITARTSGRGVVVDFVDSARLLVKHGMTGATLNVYCGLQDFEEMAFLCHYLRPNDVFGDVGANVGVYSVLASAVCGARSVAFEPVASTFTALVMNIEINGLEELCTARQVCAGAEPGYAHVTTGLGPENHVLMDSQLNPTSARVPVEPLDSAFADEGHVVLKIDVEGYEHAVLEGARDLLAKGVVGAVIIEVNAKSAVYGQSHAAALATLADAGFSPLRYDPWARTCERADRSYRTRSGNLILARSPEAAQQRCRNGRRICIRRFSTFV